MSHALVAEHKLRLNTDCVEFCSADGMQDIFAVGSYELNVETQERDGLITIMSLREEVPTGSSTTDLVEVGAREISGVFDLRWATLSRSSTVPGAIMAVACADGDVAFLDVTRHDASTVMFDQLASISAGGGMVVTVDWGRGPASDTTAVAASTSAGGAALIKVPY